MTLKDSRLLSGHLFWRGEADLASLIHISRLRVPSRLYLASESGCFQNKFLSVYQKIPSATVVGSLCFHFTLCVCVCVCVCVFVCVRCYVRALLQLQGMKTGGTNGFHVCRKTRWRHRKTLLFMKNTWNQSNLNYLPVVAAFVVCSFSVRSPAVSPPSEQVWCLKVEGHTHTTHRHTQHTHTTHTLHTDTHTHNTHMFFFFTVLFAVSLKIDSTGLSLSDEKSSHFFIEFPLVKVVKNANYQLLLYLRCRVNKLV